ncbi:MAG TPA: cytochrome c [Lacunisphaera sp.]|nr:cytochrome c [Lacunisphaera sp.]
MRAIACASAVLFLAACSKSEPPAVVAAAPATTPAAKSAAVAAAPVADKPVAPTQSAPAPAAPSHTAAAAPAPSKTGTAPAQPAASDAPKVDFDALLKQGEKIYGDTCATCHMADGNGVPFMQPGINKSAWISNPDPQYLLSLILRGAEVVGAAADAYDNKMAPQDALSDEQVAAVATYVRHRFAAEPITKPVTPAEVAVARARPGLPK